MSVEAVLIIPLLVWAIIATFTFFDAFLTQNASNRANYTVSDILSRETVDVNQDYLDSMHNMYLYMTRAKLEGTWMRVSVVRCKSSCDRDNRHLDIEWSNTTAGARPLTNGDFDLFGDYIPSLPKGDRLILVETSMSYSPPFSGFGLNFGERNLVAYSVTRPRFAPQLLWSNS